MLKAAERQTKACWRHVNRNLEIAPSTSVELLLSDQSVELSLSSFGMFCWGDASRGQLLLPAAEGHYLPKPTFISIITEPVVGVSCGENHSLIVAENGRVFSCGRNSKGQLGRAKSKDTKQPGIIEGLGGVAAVACGQEHSLALCDSGQVFSWGQNSYGQLGLGKSVPLQPVPAVIPALIGVPVIQISAGGEHTLALSCSGQVFCCGANSAGQLGLNRTDEKVCAVPALRRLPVAYISCGAAHTAVLTKDGEVYTFGDGAHGQLGHSSTSRELLPRKVEDIDGPAKQVTCGRKKCYLNCYLCYYFF
uniref:RCC1-like domain-containing protein n=1 Tax=Astyanax mexicanus TaxID=7994 RepID=A0A8B9JR19_ASTMX